MKNLTRNVWICLGLIMFPLTTFGQQKNNFTYVPAFIGRKSDYRR